VASQQLLAGRIGAWEHQIMPKVLRPMAAGDADDVVTLQEVGAIVGLGHIFHQDEHPFPAPEIRGRWLKEIETPGLDCYVILDRGRAAGFAALRADELLHFGTAMDTWGSGLAGLAHDELLAVFRSAGHRRARLRVFEENVRARRFYERRGWQATGDASRTSFPPQPVLLRYERPL